MPYSPHSETKPTLSAPNTGVIDPLNGTLSPPKTGHFIDKPYRAVKPSRLVTDNASTDTQLDDTRSKGLVNAYLVNASHARASFETDTRTREHTILSEQFCPTTGEPYPLQQG